MSKQDEEKEERKGLQEEMELSDDDLDVVNGGVSEGQKVMAWLDKRKKN